jgi:putative Mg2+ transporter-C (MgtC) family protein
MDWQLELALSGRLAIAAILGGLIGFEREKRGTDAGLRTFAMVALGACLFAIVSGRVSGGDPGRIAAGIVTGIGFLSAGVIIRSRRHIAGLTTSAAMWTTAAIGLSVGLGYVLLAAVATGLCLGVLLLRYAPIEARRHDQWPPDQPPRSS